MGAIFRTPRTIRLERDFQEMKDLKKDSTIFDFEASGDPPEHYIVTFHGKTLVPTKASRKFESETAEIESTKVGGPQQVDISLRGEYPRAAPHVQWLTPIQHPNIWGGGTVCLGNYGNAWTPYFKLADMIEILWDMARLAVLNPRSAGTGGSNAEAAWERLYRKFQFPVDRRPLRDKVYSNNEGSSIMRPGGTEIDIIIMPDDDDEANCPRE